MASEGKYMAYVGSYSYNGKAKGITVYDVDVEKGTFKERCGWKWTTPPMSQHPMITGLCIL